MTTITTNEAKALQGILDSDYMDGLGDVPEARWEPGDFPVGKEVWTWSANPFATKRTFSGTVSSLTKKGLVSSVEDGEDSTICMTRAGWDALKAWKLAQ